MRGCQCRGYLLCDWCAALAARAVGPAPGREPGSGVAGNRGRESADTPGSGSRPEQAIARPHLSERAFMQALRREALAGGWMFYHTFDSRRSAPGFCDVVCAKPGRPLLMMELKTADGVVSLAQQRWVEVLQQVTGVEAGVYRPEDMEEICRVLRG